MASLPATIISKKEELYHYIEIPQGLELNKTSLSQLRQLLNLAKGKKCLVCLPPNFTYDATLWKDCLEFAKSLFQNNIMFVAQEGVKWGDGWNLLLDENFIAGDKAKGLEWVKGKEESLSKSKIDTSKLELAGNVQLIDLKSTRYLKFTGQASQALIMLPRILEKAIAGIEIKVKNPGKPWMIASERTTTWTFFTNTLVFDVADLYGMDRRFFKGIASVLEKIKLKPESSGVYFVTSSFFETWLIRRVLGEIREAINIVRVLTADSKSNDAVKSEVENLYKQSQKARPIPFILTHQTNGVENSVTLLKQFYPDIIVADDISEANSLKEKISIPLKERLYHITPTTDPGVRLLQPQLITKGYDVRLFAEYLISRYRNHRGFPNDTYFYYLDAQPIYVKKVSNFFLMEFAEVLPEIYQKTIQKVAECETKENSQGSFTISVLQQKILKLDILLPFTNQGGAQFLGNYNELFSEHCQVLCDPMRLFLRGDRDLATQAILHLSEEYNEFLIQQPGFEIEARFQAQKGVLTVKAAPEANLERRCFTLFALLNSSSVFEQLPDKEILIEIISLMWKNYTQSSKSQPGQGFLITITATDHSTRMKIYQSDTNRIFLESFEENNQKVVTLLGNVPYYKEAQRHLLKMLSLLFNQNTPQQTAWRFSCFEAMAQVVNNTISDQKLTIELGIKGDTQRAIFISSAKDFNAIPPKSKKTLETGADKVQISNDSRQISMIKNPNPEDKEIGQLSENLLKELEHLQENAILQEVEDEKNKEAEARSLRLQKVYDSALSVYNKRYGFEEGTGKSTDEPTGKTLDEAVATRVVHHKEIGFTYKLRMGIYITAAIIVFAAAFIYLYGYNTKIRFESENQLILPDNDRPPLFMKNSDDEEEVDADAAILAKMMAVEPKVESKLPKDPGEKIVIEINNELSSTIAPTQDQLNSWLKRLYFAPDNMKQGDLYNLMGRLYFYKIQLDQEEGFFSKDWIDRWQEESREAFKKAKSCYGQNLYASNLKIVLTAWKPERIYYSNITVVEYPTSQDAVNDMQMLLDKLK